MSSDDQARADEGSHGGVDDPRDRYDTTDSCPIFPERTEIIDCPDGRVGAEAGVYFHGKPYVPEDESTSKDKYHAVRDKRDDLTESDIGKINSWMTEYMEGGFVEHMKGKVEEIKEKRLRKTKGKAKVSYRTTVVETEAEAPSSDLSISESMLVLEKLAERHEEMKHTKMALRRLGFKMVATKP